jgi:hypothetical protein
MRSPSFVVLSVMTFFVMAGLVPTIPFR